MIGSGRSTPPTQIILSGPNGSLSGCSIPGSITNKTKGGISANYRYRKKLKFRVVQQFNNTNQQNVWPIMTMHRFGIAAIVKRFVPTRRSSTMVRMKNAAPRMWNADIWNSGCYGFPIMLNGCWMVWISSTGQRGSKICNGTGLAVRPEQRSISRLKGAIKN